MSRILAVILCGLCGIEVEVSSGQIGNHAGSDRRSEQLQSPEQANGFTDGQASPSDGDSRLRGHQRSFRIASLIETQRSRQRRMSVIAQAISEDLPTVNGEALPRWLRLQQDAFWLAGRADEAISVLIQRFDALQASLSNHAMVVQAMTEGDAAAAQSRFPLSVTLYNLAENRAESEEDFVAAVLGRKHLILLRDGHDAVVDYLDGIRDQYLTSAPTLQGLAYLELAAEHNRHGRWPDARKVLHETISQFPRTDYAAQAKIFLKDWKLTPAEERQLKDGAANKPRKRAGIR